MNKENQRKAVIDLGTNTFHILIADFDKSGNWEEIYRERQYVYLASAGMGQISSAAFTRAIQTLKYFATLMRSYNVQSYKAIGTAALRSAANKGEFIQRSKEEADITIEVIDGDKEATYISRGVHLAIQNEIKEYLIMDIGGGSVEFILRKENKIIWQKSFPIGLAVLKSLEQYSDPFTAASKKSYTAFILRELQTLIDKPAIKKGLPLVGASGTFDALINLLPSEKSESVSRKIKISDLKKTFNEIMPLRLQQRLDHPDIPKERAELFPIALFLIMTVIERLSISTLFVSPYALKEGVLETMK